MSYARFGWGGSDVYVFFSVNGFYECCFCLLQEREYVEDESALLGGYFQDVGETVQGRFETAQEMVDHLMLHREAGHYVPQDCIDEILDPEDQERCRTWIQEYRGRS